VLDASEAEEDEEEEEYFVEEVRWIVSRCGL